MAIGLSLMVLLIGLLYVPNILEYKFIPPIFSLIYIVVISSFIVVTAKDPISLVVLFIVIIVSIYPSPITFLMIKTKTDLFRLYTQCYLYPGPYH